jgi:hypothetical protein
MSTPLLFGSTGLANVETQVKGLIEAAEANIERMTGQIRELTCARAREHTMLATLRLMLVPIGKLPIELLVEIFKHAVHTPLFRDTPPSRYEPTSTIFHPTARTALSKVLCLSQVSPYWRQIVLNTPRLWADGVLSVDLNRSKVDEIYLDGLRDVLARSSPFPITVSLTADGPPYPNSVVHVMTQSAKRWRAVDLHMPSFDSFASLTPGTFEVLERLQLQDLDDQTNPITAFRSSPRLRHLTLYLSHDRPSMIHLLHMPWSQLTHLSVHDNSLGACRAVLLQCSNLISARFSTSHEWDLAPQAAESSVVVLPFLKTLSVAFEEASIDEFGGTAAFFTPLALPSLTSLDLELHPEADAYEDWPTEVFSQFLLRSPSIEHITLLFCQIDSEGLIALLRHASALKKLEIRNSWNCLDDDSLQALTYDHGDDASPLAPKLQDLLFEYVGNYFDENVFEDAIRSRWLDKRVITNPRVASLQKVTFFPVEAEDLSASLITRMKDLARAQGVIFITHPE